MLVNISLYKLEEVLVVKSFNNYDDFKKYIDKNKYKFLTESNYWSLEEDCPLRKYCKQILVSTTSKGKTINTCFYVYNSKIVCVQDYIKPKALKYLNELKDSRGFINTYNLVRRFVLLEVLHSNFMAYFDEDTYIKAIW